MTAPLLRNPSLVIEAHFLAPIDGDSRSSRFVLGREPAVAAWLTTFLDYILCRQGVLPGDRRIGEPPGGETRERLIAGAVILADRRPDGGLALRLNPATEVRLWLCVRLRGQPARITTLGLGEDPDLCRWLLESCTGQQTPAPSAAAGAEHGAALDAKLRRCGVLVEELPPAAVLYPDPEDHTDLSADLATAAAVYPQAPGHAIPADIVRILGRHTPALPPGAGLLWCVDAGTGLAFPALGQPAELPAGPAGVTGTPSGTVAGDRARQWQRQEDAARRSLREDRYAVLRGILPNLQRDRLRRYVRQLVLRGYFPVPGDGQVELRSAIHNEPTIASLHQGLAEIVSSVSGERVLASYCYLGCYEAGSILHRHRDRPQCNYNLSLVLDMDSAGGEPDPWPLYLELAGNPVPVLLEVGDGLVYSGTEIWHWRDALPAGQRAVVCFFHFVPGDFTGSLD